MTRRGTSGTGERTNPAAGQNWRDVPLCLVLGLGVLVFLFFTAGIFLYAFALIPGAVGAVITEEVMRRMLRRGQLSIVRLAGAATVAVSTGVLAGALAIVPAAGFLAWYASGN